MIGFVLIGICVAVETVEQLLYRVAGRNSRRYIPVVALAISVHVTGMAFWYLLLKHQALGVVLPLTGASYATVALASSWFFRENVDARRWVGIGCIMAGVVLIARYVQI